MKWLVFFSSQDLPERLPRFFCWAPKLPADFQPASYFNLKTGSHCWLNESPCINREASQRYLQGEVTGKDNSFLSLGFSPSLGIQGPDHSFLGSVGQHQRSVGGGTAQDAWVRAEREGEVRGDPSALKIHSDLIIPWVKSVTDFSKG